MLKLLNILLFNRTSGCEFVGGLGFYNRSLGRL